jgi:hypothetical protein
MISGKFRREPFYLFAQQTRWKRIMATNDKNNWANLETQLALAIDGILFADDYENVISALGLLDGVLRTKERLPELAQTRAAELQRKLRAPDGFDLGIAAKLAVGERHAWFEAMPQEHKRDLGVALTSFLRFVCHRGAPG